MRRSRMMLTVLMILAAAGFLPLFLPAVSGAQTDLNPYINSIKQTQEGMTLAQIVQSGGVVMIILGVLSVVALTIILYNFQTIKVNSLVPAAFAEDVIQKLEKKQEESARALSRTQKNIVAGIVLAGLENKQRGMVFAREAMENYARREISKLWQNIGFLSDIANIAPLLGLLGTVLGMIKAFNVVAFQTAVVKPILLAGGVSQAMVTTAGGLIVAIPVMLFYSFFRTKVQTVSHLVESYSTDVMKLIEEL